MLTFIAILFFVVGLLNIFAKDLMWSLTSIGGPLDGSYAGPDKLKDVWGKFTKAQGEQKATVAAIAEAANPKGATVTANVAFAGKNTVKVRYVMVYRDGKLADEIWQVDPAAAY